MYVCLDCGQEFNKKKALIASEEGCLGCGGMNIDMWENEDGYEEDPYPKYDILGRPVDDNGEIIDR